MPAHRGAYSTFDRILSCASTALQRRPLRGHLAGGVATSGHANIPVPSSIPSTWVHPLTTCLRPRTPTRWAWQPIWAEIDHNTGVVKLRDIAETFQADVSEGVIQQSLLHFSPQYVGNAPGLPDVVMLTDTGRCLPCAHLPTWN